ncbi:MAG: BamA/TamA family outer membrane protein, partial [Longimicrobiales bacterium]
AYPGRIEVAAGGDFDSRTPADSAQIAAVAPQTEEIDNLRVSALLGHRNVRWVERRGLESLRGLQDVKLGAEVGLALGRSVPSIENDDDFFGTLTLYTGVEAGDGLFAFRGRTDVRRDLLAPANTEEWEDFYGDAEFLAYWHLGQLPRSTLFFRAAGLGAWNTRTPFQITLGGDRALRGYDNERFPGGRRAVFSFEHRFYAGWPFPQLFDFGTTLFADVGRIWPGDVPFGTDSGWRSSAGFGLRGAFPAGSRTSYRVDFAWPIEKHVGLRDFRVRFSIGESAGLSAAESDFQFLRSRAQTVGGPLFEFRN